MQIKDMYTQEELVFDDNNCRKAEICWKGIPENQKGPHNKIYQPYVGKDYDKSKVVVIAENFYKNGIDGDLKKAEKLAKEAKEELLQRKRVRFGNLPNKYRGTFLWYWLGAYGIMLAEKRGLDKAEWEKGMPTKESAAKGFDYLAYTNHVKCSPCDSDDKDDRGRPKNDIMWKNCAEFILKKELALLEPNWLLIMGTGKNFGSFRNYIFDKPADFTTSGSASFGKAEVTGKPVNVIVVPHPSWYGKKQALIMEDAIKSFDELAK